MVGDSAALLVVCGSVEREAALSFQSRFPNARVVSLVELFGEERAMSDVLACVEIVVAEETQ